MNKKTDFVIGMIFAALTVGIIIIFLNNDSFFDWAFNRHHNVLSWYIRPLFIIPIVYFAFKKSFAGIFISIFALFTSMFWFQTPENVDPQVISFLKMEMDYLKGTWDGQKIFMTLAVPIFFVLLILAAWKKNIKLLIGVVVGAALLKILWSLLFGGEAGMSIIIPALLGLVICVLGIFYFVGRNRVKNKNL